MRSRSLIASFAIVAGLLFAGTACAASPTPMLWKATREGKTIYLLGSLHVLLASDYPLSKDVDDAYRHASRVVFEVPPADMSPLAAFGPTSRYGMYQDTTQSLQADLDPATWQRVTAYAKLNGPPVMILDRMRPWLVALTIFGQEFQKLSYDPHEGLDMHFMEQALADHKATQGLETIDQQMSLLASGNKAEQVRDLNELLDDLPKFSVKLGHLHELWRSGDGERLYREEIQDEFKGHQADLRKLIDDRNRAWIPKLEQMAVSSQGDTLVIVGALHLLGKEGVVQLLRRDGFKIERICTGCADVH